jgi:LuxR family transcriptional regulator, maltose regulon positive regulatory protein
MHVAWVGSTIDGLRAWVAHYQGEDAVVEAWASTLTHMDDGPIPYVEEPQALLLARLLIGLGRLDRALALLARLLPQLRAQGRIGRVIEARVVEAAALDAQGAGPAALEALTEALTLAEPEGYLRTFIDAGDRVMALLKKATVAPVYTARLLRAARGAHAKVEAPGDAPVSEPSAQPVPHTADPEASAAPSPTRLPDPLSDRELEVLALMAEGETNQAIAGRLFISINTVKTHARHIYEKLDVHNRAQAARKAGKLNLLD